MGIYDREYYRREGPNYLDMLVPSGAVCKWLIGLNCALFFLQLIARGTESFWLETHFMLWAPYVYEGQVWRLLTYAFLHGDFFHLFWNMLFLWWFGSELEERYGGKEFAAFYILGAIGGGAGYLLHGAFSTTIYSAPCLGASGAVTALLLLYAFNFPTRTILVMLVLPVPIWFFVIFSIGKDVAGLFDTRHTIAVSGHLGGAAFAALYYQLGWHFSSIWDGIRGWMRARNRPKLRIYQPEDRKEPVPVGAKQSLDVDEHLEAQVDAVLEKMARTGREGLTEQERELLLKASEIYKRKRT